jgi:hypothetical protein
MEQKEPCSEREAASDINDCKTVDFLATRATASISYPLANLLAKELWTVDNWISVSVCPCVVSARKPFYFVVTA